MQLDLFIDVAPRCAYEDMVQSQAETTKHRRSSEEMLHTLEDALTLPRTALLTQKPSTSPLYQCMQIATAGLKQSA
jgi:hypothetical protein